MAGSLSGGWIASDGETLLLREKQGIKKHKAVKILNALPTTAPAMQIAGTLIAEQNYAPMFPIELVEKDLGYAEGLAVIRQRRRAMCPENSFVMGLFMNTASITANRWRS